MIWLLPQCPPCRPCDTVALTCAPTPLACHPRTVTWICRYTINTDTKTRQTPSNIYRHWAYLLPRLLTLDIICLSRLALPSEFPDDEIMSGTKATTMGSRSPTIKRICTFLDYGQGFFSSLSAASISHSYSILLHVSLLVFCSTAACVCLSSIAPLLIWFDLVREAAEISNSPSSDYAAHPLETDLFEWHFTLRGPPNSVYSEGLYHGRIVLPPTYPLRPPMFRFATPNGRFEANREICLSISGHHEETWQPAWGVRTALVA